MIETVLAVDIGTTSLKAGLVTAEGEVVLSSSYRFKNPEDRFIAKQWFYALKIALTKLNCKFENQIKLIGIAISGNGPTLVCRNGLTFRWNEELSKESINEIQTKSLFIPRILELRKRFKKDFYESTTIFSGPEFLIYKLTGKVITILPEERYKTAYWTEEELKAANIPSRKLPAYILTGQQCGNLSEYAVDYLGLKKYFNFTNESDSKLPVYAGGPDFIVALIGTNTLTVGKLCDRSGSSEGLNFCIPKPIFATGLRTLPSVIPGLWNISALIPNSSKMDSAEKMELLKTCINSLKTIAEENEIEFPSSMTVTGGQVRDSKIMEMKEKALNMKLHITNCDDAELLGDAIVAFAGLKKDGDLQKTAAQMVKIKSNQSD